MSAAGLHVITDTCIQERWTHAELARMACEGGASFVQLREKRPWTTRALVAAARDAAAALARGATRLLVNDRADVAAAAGAAGVHVGAEDLEPDAARALLGPGALIGATANDAARARSLRGAPIDYLGAGPVFGTRSKRAPAPALGLAGLERIVREAHVPVVAIGNITAGDVAAVLDAGAAGIAVLSAVVAAADPREATRELCEEMARWRGAAERAG